MGSVIDRTLSSREAVDEVELKLPRRDLRVLVKYMLAVEMVLSEKEREREICYSVLIYESTFS